MLGKSNFVAAVAKLWSGVGHALFASRDGAESPVPEKATWQTLMSWRWLIRRAKLAAGVITTLSTLAFVIWIFGLIVSTAFERHNLDLRIVTVPKSLAEAGFTDQVVTQRLADEIHAIQDRANSRIKMNNVKPLDDEVNITIPKAGISVDSIVAMIRRHVPDGWKHVVTGEIISDGTGLQLRLRMNGRYMFTGISSNQTETEIDTLLKEGAFSTIENVDPYIAAVASFNIRDLQLANALADGIIDSSPPDSDVHESATYVKGVIALEEGNETEAEDIFKRVPDESLRLFGIGYLREMQGKLSESADAYRNVLLHSPPMWLRYSVHDSLGDVLFKQGQEEAAISEYREAIRLDPNNPQPHNNIALILSKHGKEDEAVSEFRDAIQDAPKDPYAHAYLGDLLLKQGKDDDAIAEYQMAIQLDRLLADPHNGLGSVWAKQGKDNDAIAEYQMAIQLDRSKAYPYLNLGFVYVKLARTETSIPKRILLLDNACDQFAQGAKLEPADPRYVFQIKAIDGMLPAGMHCLPASMKPESRRTEKSRN